MGFSVVLSEREQSRPRFDLSAAFLAGFGSASIMKCKICTQQTDQLFLVSNGRTMINVCRECKKLTPLQMYEVLQGRCDELLTQAKANFSEAYLKRDFAGMTQSREDIEFVEQTKREMWRPECA